MWSSHGMTAYIGFILNWIDNEWVLQNRCLGAKYVLKYVQLVHCLDEILSDWRLNKTKMAAITTDNGPNNVKSCKDKQLRRNMTCFSYNLHLAITTIIARQPNVSRVIGVCKKTVAAFNMRWKRKKALSEAQLQDDSAKVPLKLPSVCMIFTILTLSFLYVCMVNTIYLLSFVETPRKFIIAELSIRKLGSSSVLIIRAYY